MKNLIIFLAGAAAGTGVTYYCLRKYYNDQMESTIQEIKLDYDERLKSQTNASQHETEEQSDESEGYVKPENYSKTSRKNHKTEDNQFDYNALSKDGLADENQDEEPEEMISHITVKTEPPKGRKRYCISPDEFIELDGREKITLTYFEGDQVFMDENEQVDLNGLKNVGKSNLDHVGDYEDGTLYVRNDDNGTDYEIIFDDRSYADFIEGRE